MRRRHGRLVDAWRSRAAADGPRRGLQRPTDAAPPSGRPGLFAAALLTACTAWPLAGLAQDEAVDPLLQADRLAAASAFDARAFAQTFAHRDLMVRGIPLHVVEGGQGPAVLLLHGWPETWYSWRRVMPALAAHHRVVALDLPGFGDSGPAPAADTRAIAEIVDALAVALRLGPTTVVGHDMGGPVAYALAASHPEWVARLVLSETAIPGFGFADGSAQDILNPTPQSVGGIWHFAFFMKPGMPEMLVAGHERAFVEAMVRDSYSNRSALARDEIDELVRWISAPGGLSGGLAYYRALFEDARQNRLLAQTPLTLPVLLVNGGDGFLQHVSPASVRAVAKQVTVEVAPHSGHFIAAERPGWLAAALIRFEQTTRAGPGR